MEILLRNGADDQALPLAEAATRAFEDLGDDWGRSAVPMHLGAGLRLAGRTQEAVAVLHRTLEVCRAAGLENNVARVYVELGGAAADVGDTDEALRWYGESERVVRGLRVVPYGIPPGCIGSYYPEANPLVPLHHHDRKAHTPAYKAVPVRISLSAVNPSERRPE